jgi:hypothetical protein
MTALPRTAVIFRTHFWDAFCQRQFDRLQVVAENTTIFVLVDETQGRVAGITHPNLVSVTETDLLAMGFARAGEGNLLWFNGDYPLYRFFELHPDFDYYVQLEYDVVVNQPLIGIAAAMARDDIDFVGLTKGEPVPEWFWLDSMLQAYDLREIRHQLICLCAFSAAALRHLWRVRLEQSRTYQSGRLTAWPFCEGFIPTELQRAGFVSRELSAFGETGAYDHWPPFLETDAARMGCDDFIHPVLDEPRYISSLHKYHVGLGGYLNPKSQFHQKLRRLPPRQYVVALAASFVGKARRNIARAAALLAGSGAALSGKG